MDIVRLSQAYRVYLASPDVRAVCDSKIHTGLRKVEAAFRASMGKVSTDDLDAFYKKAPAYIRFFKTTTVQDAIKSFDISYAGWNESAKKLDVYNKALYFLTVVKLVKFWHAVTADNQGVTLESTGVSKSVLARTNLVRDLMNMSEADAKAKVPDAPSLKYIEMGLKRIISMEVGSDDWDK